MTTDISTTHPNAKVHARRWWILAILSLSVFLVVVDNLIINVAIPRSRENSRPLPAVCSG